jgi:hypothetical protein
VQPFWARDHQARAEMEKRANRAGLYHTDKQRRPRQVLLSGAKVLRSYATWFLLEGLSPCPARLACHTPKISWVRTRPRKTRRNLTLQGWFAPDITNDELTEPGQLRQARTPAPLLENDPGSGARA